MNFVDAAKAVRKRGIFMQEEVQGVLLLMASTENSALLQEKIVQKTGFLQLVMFCFILIADLLAAACLLMGLMPQGLLDLIREAVTL